MQPRLALRNDRKSLPNREDGTIAGSGGWRFKAGCRADRADGFGMVSDPYRSCFLLMSGATIAATTAGIVTANKLILLLAIVVMGKPGFQELKARLSHKLSPATEVSRTRYRIGFSSCSVCHSCMASSVDLG